MARFNRRRHDYRGEEFDDRFGRYEGAFARRAALDAWIDEGRHGDRGSPPPPWSDRGAQRQPIPPEIDYADDQDGHAFARGPRGYGSDYVGRPTYGGLYRGRPGYGWEYRRRPEYDVDYGRTWAYSRRWWPQAMQRSHRHD